MRKSNYLVMILFLLSILTACSTNSTIPTSTDPNPRLEDLDYFCEMLENNHVNLYANISRREFEIEKQKIAERTSTMSDSQFFYSLKHLLSLVGDAHTNVFFIDSQYKHLNALAFDIVEYNDGWYLMMLEKENEQYLGCKLLAINNIEIDEIFNRAKGIISYENEYWAKRKFSNTINFRESLEFLDIIKKDERIVLSVEDSSGSKHSLEIKSMNEQEVKDAQILRVAPTRIPVTAKYGIYSAMPLNKDSFFIQYNSCQEATDLSMNSFVSIISEEIKKNNYKNVIIDLRYNSGGDARIFEPMISELSKLQEENNFKVYTIISKNTFSATVINAIQIKKQLNSKLVGTPTGGNVNFYGGMTSFNLKHAPISVVHSTEYYELIKGYEKDSLYPDIYIEQNFENYINGVDSEVDMILLIEN